MRPSDPVNRLMTTPVHSIEPDKSVTEAVRMFAKHPFHHLPVCEGGRVVGVLSSADLCRLEFFNPAGDAGGDRTLTIGKIMQSPALTVPEHESVQRAVELMQKRGVHSIPVVNSREELVGIVTTTDIIGACLGSGLARGSSAVSQSQPTNDVSQQRLYLLEQVLRTVKRYLLVGQDERLHAELDRAVAKIDRLDAATRHAEVTGLSVG